MRPGAPVHGRRESPAAAMTWSSCAARRRQITMSPGAPVGIGIGIGIGGYGRGVERGGPLGVPARRGNY